MLRISVLMLLLLGGTSAFAAGNLVAGEKDSTTSQPSLTQKTLQAKSTACVDMSPEDATKLGLIRQMLEDGKPHAAIAHLEAARITNPQSDLLRADGLRRTGREALAEEVYRRLLNSCVAGYAYQGLGLIASKSGKTKEAIAHLKAASAALPTEHTIRNDYGYVLMMAGDSKSALHEFLTALELVADYRQAANNLILMLYRDGEGDRAKSFADKFGITANELTQLQEMAGQVLTNANINQDGTGVK